MAQTQRNQASTAPSFQTFISPEADLYGSQTPSQQLMEDRSLYRDRIQAFLSEDLRYVGSHLIHYPSVLYLPPDQRRSLGGRAAGMYGDQLFSDGLGEASFGRLLGNDAPIRSSYFSLKGLEQIRYPTSIAIPSEGSVDSCFSTAPTTSSEKHLHSQPQLPMAGYIASPRAASNHPSSFNSFRTGKGVTQTTFNPLVASFEPTQGESPVFKNSHSQHPQPLVRVQQPLNKGSTALGSSTPNADGRETDISSLLNSMNIGHVSTSDSTAPSKSCAKIGANGATKIYHGGAPFHIGDTTNTSTKTSATEERQEEKITGEPLDARFSIVPKPQRFFKVGRVFMTLWSEPASSTARDSLCVSSSPLGGKIFSETRRFVVVKSNPGYSICCPIQTYQRRGSSKPAIKLQSHARVYKAGTEPETLLEEDLSGTGNFPIVIEDRFVTIDSASRLNFGKVYTVEHNIKVRNVGKISKESIPRLKTAFFTSMGMGASDMETDTGMEIGR